jgi:anti-anti-sigma factor
VPQTKPQACGPAESAVAAGRFACEVTGGRGAAWVSPSGELDLASATHFSQTLDEALERSLLVIIDLRAVTFIDSAGLHAIVAADNRAQHNGHRLMLIRGSEHVARLFELVGLTSRLRIVDLTPDPITYPGSRPCPDQPAVPPG